LLDDQIDQTASTALYAKWYADHFNQHIAFSDVRCAVSIKMDFYYAIASAELQSGNWQPASDQRQRPAVTR
jgi:hypothetical protein